VVWNAQPVMKAIVYHSAGGPEVLHLVERPVSEPGPGEVRGRIHVSGVNPTDGQRSNGTTQEFVVLPERQSVPLPDSASFELGASLGIPAVTAHRTLTVAEGGPERLAPVALSSRTVLVAGGAGAVAGPRRCRTGRRRRLLRRRPVRLSRTGPCRR